MMNDECSANFGAEMTGRSKQRWAVVGFSHDTAQHIMSDIENNCNKTVSRKVFTRNELRTEFNDGTVLRWVPAREASRGLKFEKMWCDRSIDNDTLQCIVFPMYRGGMDEIVWL